MGDVWLSDDRLISREDWEKFLKDAMETEIKLEFEKWADDRMFYLFKAPEILEKAWKMPFQEDKETYLRPVVCLAGLENLDECVERSNDTCMAILEAQRWFLRNKSFEEKDWRNFK